MSVFIAYLVLGAFFVTFALGKDMEQFRDKEDGDGGFIIAVNAIVGVFLWPVVVLVSLDLSMDAKKAKNTAKKDK
jgi:hypothetical protein